MDSWDAVKARKDALWAEVLKGLNDAERSILIDLIQLEVENRTLAQPRTKAPLRKKVEGYIP